MGSALGRCQTEVFIRLVVPDQGGEKHGPQRSCNLGLSILAGCFLGACRGCWPQAWGAGWRWDLLPDASHPEELDLRSSVFFFFQAAEARKQGSEPTQW